jgi:signal transduction histidine kinase
MLRDAAAALERDQGSEAPQTEMSGTLDKIREALSEMAAGSRRDISTLASQVDEDSKTIASIESAARRRGIGLKLTRGELVQRYAELNQEIVQPLTVSSGVIDLLSSGKAGDLSESQLELLKMAAESVDRVNQLVSHMSSISGLPESFTPDREVISDSYR